ncbi:hypothetical protein LMG22037_05515 [Paraburkholderia phenoliruptrix]|uniref:Uncharacterized protein n=1 Tax=Paraburkholderia phenoliruptrix TaxID=252970 RepID=A0A6J5C868_9BURK|nr:hypothetical protein LMG22037_05515 [Paraburkholderia phenoliruptrix]
MKRVIGWPIAWALFWIGHVLSRPLIWWHWADCLAPVLYPAYSRCMLASSDVQDWAGTKGPWEAV